VALGVGRDNLLVSSSRKFDNIKSGRSCFIGDVGQKFSFWRQGDMAPLAMNGYREGLPISYLVAGEFCEITIVIFDPDDVFTIRVSCPF
jgi:hypothetical protein